MDEQIVVVPDNNKPERRISTRELDIVRCIGRGLNNREIAVELGLSQKTVETHRHRVLVRLGCRNMPQLITVLFRQQILS